MKLSQLLSGIPIIEIIPGPEVTGEAPDDRTGDAAGDPPHDARAKDALNDLDIAEVRDDSRKVQRGDLFVALPGQSADGHRFLKDAAARGMAAALVERALPPGELSAPQLRVPATAPALALLAQNRYRRPADELLLCAVTGTNGKTTTSFLIESMLQHAGHEAGLIGTVLYRYRGRSMAAPWTTPAPLELHRVLREMRDAGVSAVAMEASSHALTQGRLFGVRFRIAAFTNLTQDHLDFHGDMDGYFDAKARLMRDHLLPAEQGGVAVINLDDAHGPRMAAEVRGARLLTVSLRGDADVSLVREELSMDGITASLRTPVGEVEVRSPLIGRFNLENLAVAVGVGVGLGLNPAVISAGLLAVSGVPGRVERVAGKGGGPAVFVDYAHSPDALVRVIAALRPLLAAAESEGRRPGRLLVVFGCGGDRDQGKRPKMGQAVADGADLCIITSDNPRGESPIAIIDAIIAGIGDGPDAPRPLARPELVVARRGYFVEPDRRQAIRAAILSARPEDVVLIAGKGHEDYQIIGAARHHFDDREEAAEALRRWGDPIPTPAEPQVSRPVSGPGLSSALLPTIDLPLERVLAATSGTLLRGTPRRFTQVVIDGRAAGPGALYVAIRGAVHDGHTFVAQALEGGAAGVLVERGRGADLPGLLPETVVVEVGDTTVALGQLARAHRHAPEIARNLQVVAVTGSMGKTSTKDLLAAILDAHAPGAVLKTVGNLNNHYGVPLTLLGLRAGHRYAVLELGMSARGEIAYLTSLLTPDVGVLTNVGPVHLSSLGNVDNVARAKGELLLGLPDEAAAVYPVGPGHERVLKMAVLAGAGGGRLRPFPVRCSVGHPGAEESGKGGAAARPVLRAELTEQGPEGLDVRLHLHRHLLGGPEAEGVPEEVLAVHVPLVGAHQADNAALAVAAALALDVPPAKIAAGLLAVQPAKHRGQLREVAGRHLLDDCYNASPLAVQAALRTLVALRGDGRALFVFGDMLELGEGERALHEEIGAAAPVDLLVAVGPLAACAAAARKRAGGAAVAVGTPEEAAAVLAAQSRPGDWILVKGSRGVHLESVLDLLPTLLRGSRA